MTRTIRLTMLALSLSAAPAFGQPVRTGNTQANRPALEQQFRERVAGLAQQRIGLSDAQMAQLEQSNARFGPQLNQLAAQERETRRQLRGGRAEGSRAVHDPSAARAVHRAAAAVPEASAGARWTEWRTEGRSGLSAPAIGVEEEAVVFFHSASSRRHSRVARL